MLSILTKKKKTATSSFTFYKFKQFPLKKESLIIKLYEVLFNVSFPTFKIYNPRIFDNQSFIPLKTSNNNIYTFFLRFFFSFCLFQQIQFIRCTMNNFCPLINKEIYSLSKFLATKFSPQKFWHLGVRTSIWRWQSSAIHRLFDCSSSDIVNALQNGALIDRLLNTKD